MWNIDIRYLNIIFLCHQSISSPCAMTHENITLSGTIHWREQLSLFDQLRGPFYYFCSPVRAFLLCLSLSCSISFSFLSPLLSLVFEYYKNTMRLFAVSLWPHAAADIRACSARRSYILAYVSVCLIPYAISAPSSPRSSYRSLRVKTERIMPRFLFPTKRKRAMRVSCSEWIPGCVPDKC